MEIRVLLRTVVMVALVQILAVITARYFSLYTSDTVSNTAGFSAVNFLILFFAATLIFLLFMKWYKGNLLYQILFYGVVTFGLINIFSIIFPVWIIPIIIALFITALIVTPYVWVHNLTVGLAAAGIGPMFGLQMSWQVASIILLALSLYDMIAVYWTKHMVEMAYRMLKSKAIFGLIIPQYSSGHNARIESVQPGAGFLILGGGDLIIPMLLTCSLLATNPNAAYTSLAGTLVGVAANHVVLVTNKRPIPALPLIAAGAILGALVGFYV